MRIPASLALGARKLGRFVSDRRGMNLTELMVALSILSIAVLGFVASFQYISKAIHVSRGKSLAANLAQEKIENLKDLSYHKLLLSTVTANDSNFSPQLTYDTISYPQESITIGGMSFLRRTHVAFAEVTDNIISTITYTYPDPGLKLVRVYVVWFERSAWKKLELHNLYENPNIDPLNTTIQGDVAASGGGSVASALVEIIENPDWNDLADTSGDYSFKVHAGTYTVRASSSGYFSATTQNVGAATAAATTVNFTLTKIATGTVAGGAWYNEHLVISQIVASTVTTLGGLTAGVDVEYVELFNPTTFSINIGASVADHQVGLEYRHENGGGLDTTDAEFALTYLSTYVAPGDYYLIASTRQFYVLGTLVTADAVYGTANAKYIRPNDAGCLWIYNMNNTSQLFDRVGWCDDTTSGTAPHYCTVPSDCYEGEPLADSSLTDGPLIAGTQIIRISSPLLVSSTYGRAYDAGVNRYDFAYSTSIWIGTIDAPPYSTANDSQTVIAGKPAYYANVTADDLLGPSTQAYKVTMTNGFFSHAFARFELQGVATGTWNVIVASGASYTLHAGVVVTAGVMTAIPNSATSPPWDLSGHYGVRLQSSTVEGFIAGDVLGVDGKGLSGIQVSAAGVTKTTGSNGRYFAQVSSGPITVVANPGNANTSFVESIAQPTITTGQLTTQNFTLSQGGIIQGFCTTDGSSVLPNVEVAATISGIKYGSGTSDSSGNFYIKNLSTGTYTIAPVLDPAESSDPASKDSTVSSTATINVGTFTVTGALGTIEGTVKYNSVLMTSGALILASTKTISATPPKIAASSAPAQTFIYAASSKADGTYSLDVRGSASAYNLSVYLPIIQSDNSITVTTKTYTGVSVTASQTTTKNLEIP